MINEMESQQCPGPQEPRVLYESCRNLKREIHKVIIGQDEVIDSVLCCILAGGHCLVQGVPGLAKTLLVRAVAQALDMTYNRIQFTPDLMPSDITGNEIITEDPDTGRREYLFVRGPVFANILLADEINRTAPRTQSALLQAMQEREVTVAGKTWPLESPFFVMATQNPIEQEGTYPLPEAALDRFMFMVYIDYPACRDEVAMVRQTTGVHADQLQKVLDRAQLAAMQRDLTAVPISQGVIDYAVSLARATRPKDETATAMVRTYFKWGAGPRAGQYMARGARAHALIDGRLTPSFEDVRFVAKAVLRHRVITNFNAEADGVGVEDILDDLLKRIQPK